MNKNIKEGVVEFGNESVKSGNFTFFVPQDNTNYRITFISPHSFMRRRHFNENKRKYVCCLIDEGFCPACEDPATSSSQDMFGVWAWKYITKKDGVAIIGDPEDGELILFKFTAKKFEEFRSVYQINGKLRFLDMKLAYTDSKRSKYSITAIPEGYADKKEFKSFLEDQLESVSELNVLDFIQKKISLKEMYELLDLDESDFPHPKNKSEVSPKETVIKEGSKPVLKEPKASVEDLISADDSKEEVESPADKKSEEMTAIDFDSIDFGSIEI